MAKPRISRKQQSRSNIIILLFVIVTSSLLAGLFFKDYRQVPYEWFITIIWLAAGFFSLAFGILYFAQFILPHHEGESWLEGVAMLLRGGARLGEPPMRSKRKENYPGQKQLPISFDSLRAGVLRSHQVLAVNNGTQFERAAGPGFVRLGLGEEISQAIDLRKHMRSQVVTINTRDGIPLETNVSVTFQIKQSDEQNEGKPLEYPYNQSAIFQVSQASSVDVKNELLPWTEQLAPQAASYLVSEMAQFSLNEISQDPRLLSGVQNRVRRQLKANFDGMGIKIFNVGVALRDLPAEIIDRRMTNWRAPWLSQMQAQAASSNVHKIRRIKQARARAQVQIIEDIMKSIDEMRRKEDAILPQVVTLRMIEALDEAISSQSLQTRIPGEMLAGLTLETSSQMHARIEPPVEDEESDG